MWHLNHSCYTRLPSLNNCCKLSYPSAIKLWCVWYLCIYVRYLCVCFCVLLAVFSCGSKSKKSVSDVFLYCSMLYFSETVVHHCIWSLSCQLDWMATKPPTSVYLLTPIVLGFHKYTTGSGFYMSAGDLNSGPQKFCPLCSILNYLKVRLTI